MRAHHAGSGRPQATGYYGFKRALPKSSRWIELFTEIARSLDFHSTRRTFAGSLDGVFEFKKLLWALMDEPEGKAEATTETLTDDDLIITNEKAPGSPGLTSSSFFVARGGFEPPTFGL